MDSACSIDHQGIRLILETDAIVPPLTGIGRYTLELVKGLHHNQDIGDLKCISRGQWHSPETIINEQLELDNIKYGGSAPNVKGRWRRNPVKMIARRFLPLVQMQALQKFSDSHIYHAPNYRLTPYRGKKIATFHDLSLFKYSEFHPEERLKILIPAIEQAAESADHLITDSQQVRLELLEYFGLHEDKVTAIHLASSLDPQSIDPIERQKFMNQTGLTSGQYLLFVSTLEPRKNITKLLTAYETLPAALRRNYPLVLAGQLGWKSELIKNALHRGMARGDVHQLGYLSNQQLCYLYSGARAFVYPSLYEGFGLPLIEAQTFGVPVVTSNLSCMPEIVGDSGILVNPQDEIEISTAMLKIIEDDSLHGELSQKAYINAARYSWSKTTKKVIETYRLVRAL
jgi:glycosyltransferase involved in cell wall biosynthesis